MLGQKKMGEPKDNMERRDGLFGRNDEKQKKMESKAQEKGITSTQNFTPNDKNNNNKTNIGIGPYCSKDYFESVIVM